uniref:Uncharacterized protein n=1 Tax=Romanomermis culicivorax TaxID=13658 RepID=A0A915IAF8_ROMCU
MTSPMRRKRKNANLQFHYLDVKETDYRPFHIKFFIANTLVDTQLRFNDCANSIIFVVFEGIFAVTFKERTRSGLSRQSSIEEVSEPRTDDEITDRAPPTPSSDDEDDGDDNGRVTVGARRSLEPKTAGSRRGGGERGIRRDDDDNGDWRRRGKSKGKANVEKSRGGKHKGRWSHLLQDVQKLHGTNKHKGKKKGKRDKFKNEKSYLWQGKLVRRAGPDASDPAPAIHVPEHDEIQHLARSCKIDFQHTSKGPSADGAQSEHFQPCQERKRGGHKRGKWTQQEQPLRSERKKRSESYSSVRLLWPDPERILIKFDSSCTTPELH